MTALAPRRRPIFGRKTGFGPSLRIIGIAAGVSLIAGVSFAAGVSYGANNETGPVLEGVFAAADLK